MHGNGGDSEVHDSDSGNNSGIDKNHIEIFDGSGKQERMVVEILLMVTVIVLMSVVLVPI